MNDTKNKKSEPKTCWTNPSSPHDNVIGNDWCQEQTQNSKIPCADLIYTKVGICTQNNPNQSSSQQSILQTSAEAAITPAMSKKYVPVMDLTESIQSMCDFFEAGMAANIQQNCPTGCLFYTFANPSMTNFSSPYLTTQVPKWTGPVSNTNTNGWSCMPKSYCDNPSYEISSQYNGCTKSASSFYLESKALYQNGDCPDDLAFEFIKFLPKPICN